MQYLIRLNKNLVLRCDLIQGERNFFNFLLVNDKRGVKIKDVTTELTFGCL